MPRSTTLQRIIDPVTVDEFAHEYFQRRPLAIPGAPDKFDFLFRQEDFQVNLDRVDFLRAMFAGNLSARIQPADIKNMLDAGATICVNGMEMAHPKLLRAARRVREQLKFAGHASFRAYLSPPDKGFDLHFDARVTTTLQIAGSKQWWFSREPAIPFPLHNSGPDPSGAPPQYTVPDPNTLESIVLRPGDVLCLPAGIWHRARAVTTSLALNLALDHYGAGIFDSIVSMLDERLKQDPAWRRPLPVAPNHDVKRVPNCVASVLRDRIDALQMELSALRDDDAELQRIWQMALRARSRT